MLCGNLILLAREDFAAPFFTVTPTKRVEPDFARNRQKNSAYPIGNALNFVVRHQGLEPWTP